MKQRSIFDGTIDNHPAGANANVESNSGNAPLRTDEAPAFDSPVHITFHHTRKRLADIDGLSGKAAIDGLVEAGILANDTAKQVTKVTHSQSQGNQEQTTITIEIDKRN